MNQRHDEHAWRAGLARRRHARPKRKLSRRYPRYRAPRLWSAMPLLKVGVALALALIAIKVTIHLAV